jgi:hypothetical protein
MLEYHPDAYIKFIILEGTGRIFRNNRVGESVLVRAGQMLIVSPKGTTLPDPVDVDLDRLSKTSALLSSDFAPLSSTNLIAQEIRVQEQKKAENALLDTNLVIYGGGTAVSLIEATATIDQRIAGRRPLPGNRPLQHRAQLDTQSDTSPTPSPTSTPSNAFAHSEPNTFSHPQSNTFAHAESNTFPTPSPTPTPHARLTPTPTITQQLQQRSPPHQLRPSLRHPRTRLPITAAPATGATRPSGTPSLSRTTEITELTMTSSFPAAP